MITENLLVFEINKTNTALLSENSKIRYVIGIGKTDYTIHRDADDIKKIYFPKYNQIENSRSIRQIHNFHVFQSSLKSICGEIRFRKSFKHKGKVINVKRAYIGVPNYCEIVYNPGSRRTGDSITSNGQDYKLANERVMYIIETL